MISWVFRLPSNFGMSEGSFVGMGGQLGSCAMESLVSLVKSDRFNSTKKGDWEVDAMETCEDTKFWLEQGLVCDVPWCEFNWLPVWDVLATYKILA